MEYLPALVRSYLAPLRPDFQRRNSDVASDADIEAAFEWYEYEQLGLGLEFLDEVRAAYTRILEGPT